jgi:hypothetical protein
MSLVMQQILVAVVGVLAALAAIWLLATARIRLRILAVAIRMLGDAEGGFASRLRTFLQSRIDAAAGSGCGTCGKSPPTRPR